MSKPIFKEYIKSQSVSDLHLNEECITCSPKESVLSVAQILAKSKIGSILIVSSDAPKIALGIFTERDLIRCVANPELNLATEEISKHMTPNPKTISRATSLYSMMAAMRIGRFRHLVVSDDSGRFCGVISIRDIVVHLVDELA
jgi:CBS domain-containing protein